MSEATCQRRVELARKYANFWAQRTNEISIRLALGAQPQGIVRLVVRQSLRMALLGLSIGVVTTFAVTGVLRSLLYEVEPHDPMTLVIVSILLLGVALAAFLPALRASRVDPAMALRAE